MGAWGRVRRTPEQEAAFRASVQAALDLHSISDVVGRDTALKPAGRLAKKGLCVFHKEKTPSFYVYDGGANFHCFGCGANGDTIDYLMRTRNLSFGEAMRWLGASDLPIINEAERIQRKADDQAARAREIADARMFWGQCVDPVGTLGEVYLRQARGITMQLPPSIRYGVIPPWRDRDTDEWVEGRPAVVCAIYDRGGSICGIQRIFLRRDGRDKANMRKPKLTLGRVRGASLRLGPVQRHIITCEGPEDGLSLAGGLPGESVWPALGTGLMPVVEYPEEVCEITVAGQNDDAGREATERAAKALAEQGFKVQIMFPDPNYKDWNDQLRGIRR